MGYIWGEATSAPEEDFYFFEILAHLRLLQGNTKTLLGIKIGWVILSKIVGPAVDFKILAPLK